MRTRRIFALALTLAVSALLGGASVSQASPGALQILLDGNDLDLHTEFQAAIAAHAGVTRLDTFNSFTATPSSDALNPYDLVVDTGDSDYFDPAAYGDALASYIDQGGALIQFAYDNWKSVGAHPTGRFDSGGYAPFIPGHNDNMNVTLGPILVPSSPLMAKVPSFFSQFNTNDALASGATLLAGWSDGRNAIATKGRVVSVTAAPQDGAIDPVSAAAQLVVNAGNTLSTKPTGQRAAALKKCRKLKKSRNKKRFRKCKKKARKLPV